MGFREPVCGSKSPFRVPLLPLAMRFAAHESRVTTRVSAAFAQRSDKPPVLPLLSTNFKISN